LRVQEPIAGPIEYVQEPRQCWSEAYDPAAPLNAIHVNDISMTQSAPKLPILVDDETGIWTTDGMPMIYIPRHFYVNHHEAFEKAFGREVLQGVLYEAGYKSAWQWCEKEALVHGLRGLDVFRHYLSRLSLRGWGQFTVLELDEETGIGKVRLDHSIYVEHHGSKTGRTLCYPFGSWLVGSLEWAGKDLGRPWKLEANEVECAGHDGRDGCIFLISPLTA
jgi:hypothetical protein